MKKTIIFLSLFFYFGIASVFAQPPCPESSTFTTVRLYAGDCEYYVDICIRCGTDIEAGYFSIFGFAKVDPDCKQALLFEEVLTSLNDQMMTESFIRAHCNNNIPPCPSGILVNNQFYDCWRKKLDPVYGLYYYTCTPADVCTTGYFLCWDGIQYTFTPIYNNESNNSNCPGINENLVPDPTIPNEESECFSVTTPCP